LLCSGIENIACHLVGKEVWEAIFPESSVCLNQPVHFSGSVPADFVPAELCLLCDRQRTEAATESVDKKVVMCDSDSGVCSASPPTSPRASQPVPSASTEATLLCMTSLYERTREAIMRMQAAQQFEMMSQMQMLGLLGMAPAVTPEINRIMFENRKYKKFFFTFYLLVLLGLEAIIDIETSNYNQKQRKQSQPQSDTIEKETNGQEEIVRNGYGIKRNYSQVDLTAAVNDIRCGRLGTRRASVVYGIPRSTLRNKIYKLEAAEEQAGQAPLNKRRRPGGQSNAEKKLAEQVERQKKASTPVTDCSSISPSSDGTDGETSMTADVMGTGGKEDGKKEELSEWKKSRPKRGQYRKYDKNALDEAVRSVRRGEMSVHRAGSYYGVPHSTLEYKVKERNLLRKKKDSPPVKEISLMQEPMTSLNISEESSSPVIAV
uniref:HTH psq-type domain-containing protein n=1 Tax=Haemonchus placei TaxID=6290 RepID=A0A0N4WU43_HAEPC